MEGELGERVYRLLETRPRVLVNSLLESRTKWKEKCGVSKVELQAFRGVARCGIWKSVVRSGEFRQKKTKTPDGILHNNWSESKRKASSLKTDLRLPKPKKKTRRR